MITNRSSIRRAIPGHVFGAVTSRSVLSDDEAPMAEIRAARYWCETSGHVLTVPFAAQATPPPTWECPNHARPAQALFEAEPAEPARPAKWSRPARTHLDIVRERRTDAELRALLEERLEVLRARRGSLVVMSGQ